MREYVKHRVMMTPEEIKFIEDKLPVDSCPRLSRHASNRIIKRRINLNHIVSTYKHGEVVEFMYKKMAIQVVVIRSKMRFRGRYLYIVCDVFTKDLITAYYVKSREAHKRVNIKKYDSFDIIRACSTGKVILC